MDTSEILHNGHLTVLRATQSVPASAWETPGVCGVWSVKDVVAHLASFERVLVEVLTSFLRNDPTPTLDRFVADILVFNDDEVAQRKEHTAAEVLAEYEAYHVQAADLLKQIPPEMRWQNGTLSWYGEDYALDDFIVYSFYGHKQEHCAQLAVFCDRLVSDQAVQTQEVAKVE